MINRLKFLSTKFLLVILALTTPLVAVPVMEVHAAGMNDQQAQPSYIDNTRLEHVWAREVAIFHRAEFHLNLANKWTGRLQALINRADARGWDTSAIQAALNNFKDALQKARPILESARGIVASHKGFDSDGHVVDRTLAVQSVKDLGQHLKDARLAIDGTWKALRDSIRDFRESHSPLAPVTQP